MEFIAKMTEYRIIYDAVYHDGRHCKRPLSNYHNRIKALDELDAAKRMTDMLEELEYTDINIKHVYPLIKQDNQIEMFA